MFLTKEKEYDFVSIKETWGKFLYTKGKIEKSCIQ